MYKGSGFLKLSLLWSCFVVASSFTSVQRRQGSTLPLNLAPTMKRCGTRKSAAFNGYFKNGLQSMAQQSKHVLGVTTAEISSEKEENSNVPFPLVLWRFTRPHTLIGSALAIPSLTIFAAPSLKASLSVSTLCAMIYAMIPALFMNLYITGLNQITDVDIDKINKPNLPIAAGDLSLRSARIIVTGALVLSIWIGVAHPVLGSQGLNVALWGSGILGTMYSLEPFRFKRFPLLAALCIVAVRGTIINAGFFAHAQAAAYGNPTATVLQCLLSDRKCMLSTVFFGIFGVVIALMKDVPDVTGDEKADIRTFSVRIGQKRVFNMMRRLLTLLFLAFGGGFFRGAFAVAPQFLGYCRLSIGCLCIAAGMSVTNRAAEVNPESSSQVYDFYMHLWKLFYLSYLALPFVR